MLDVMVFSRNRALQLYALLESIDEYFDNDKVNVSVLYRYDDDHIGSIEEVIESFSAYNFINEINFENQVKDFLSKKSEYVAFLTDDIIFKDQVNVDQIAEILGSNPQLLTFSLRMGLHIHECWSVNCEQPFPPGQVYSPNMFVWNWSQGAYDWGYPFSVDGHVFRKNQFHELTKSLKYRNPNSFEDVIQGLMHVKDIPQAMICYSLSKLVNLPVNRVQETHKNRCGDEDSKFLLDEYWDKGKKIDILSYNKILNRGAHAELELVTKDR
jgi:hypothetical protein